MKFNLADLFTGLSNQGFWKDKAAVLIILNKLLSIE